MFPTPSIQLGELPKHMYVFFFSYFHFAFVVVYFANHLFLIIDDYR